MLSGSPARRGRETDLQVPLFDGLDDDGGQDHGSDMLDGLISAAPTQLPAPGGLLSRCSSRRDRRAVPMLTKLGSGGGRQTSGSNMPDELADIDSIEPSKRRRGSPRQNRPVPQELEAKSVPRQEGQ